MNPQVHACPYLCHPPDQILVYTTKFPECTARQPDSFSQCHWHPDCPGSYLPKGVMLPTCPHMCQSKRNTGWRRGGVGLGPNQDPLPRESRHPGVCTCGSPKSHRLSDGIMKYIFKENKVRCSKFSLLLSSTKVPLSTCPFLQCIDSV